mmetsp:Transcript_33599/g.51733  ORF Transcript_33599/g.51733 Transcript_33599/m.51733 type:complete len:108 (+) Transcript_33599:4951-5274(+)
MQKMTSAMPMMGMGMMANTMVPTPTNFGSVTQFNSHHNMLELFSNSGQKLFAEDQEMPSMMMSPTSSIQQFNNSKAMSTKQITEITGDIGGMLGKKGLNKAISHTPN